MAASRQPSQNSVSEPQRNGRWWFEDGQNVERITIKWLEQQQPPRWETGIQNWLVDVVSLEIQSVSVSVFSFSFSFERRIETRRVESSRVELSRGLVSHIKIQMYLRQTANGVYKMIGHVPVCVSVGIICTDVYISESSRSGGCFWPGETETGLAGARQRGEIHARFMTHRRRRRRCRFSWLFIFWHWVSVLVSESVSVSVSVSPGFSFPLTVCILSGILFGVLASVAIGLSSLCHRAASAAVDAGLRPSGIPSFSLFFLLVHLTTSQSSSEPYPGSLETYSASTTSGQCAATLAAANLRFAPVSVSEYLCICALRSRRRCLSHCNRADCRLPPTADCCLVSKWTANIIFWTLCHQVAAASPGARRPKKKKIKKIPLPFSRSPYPVSRIPYTLLGGHCPAAVCSSVFCARCRIRGWTFEPFVCIGGANCVYHWDRAGQQQSPAATQESRRNPEEAPDPKTTRNNNNKKGKRKWKNRL